MVVIEEEKTNTEANKVDIEVVLTMTAEEAKITMMIEIKIMTMVMQIGVKMEAMGEVIKDMEEDIVDMAKVTTDMVEEMEVTEVAIVPIMEETMGMEGEIIMVVEV